MKERRKEKRRKKKTQNDLISIPRGRKSKGKINLQNKS